ncbi:9193_t:CDS:2 [Diversispora eburnea]|uniref:9193_t:CDS:1 n=1 Tax=Diversispora eburnea TaxID=1213867 RepID=A0A9N8V647_9GLOM|nr:9193_t:CDS:2 [Diversispora eburnea]
MKKEAIQDHKFDFVNVYDFEKKDCLHKMKYSKIFFIVLKSVLVYIADLWTACALLLTDKWGSAINPEISFSISKWIFVGSIVISYILLFWEIKKAHAIVISGDISFAFTNMIAYRYFALTSYAHWCFFEAIRERQKGLDKIAFFVYFAFKGWKRLLLCDGPRQVINFITIIGFLKNIKFSTDPDKYGSLYAKSALGIMAFTVSIFFISLSLLLFAFILYLPLLCCYVKGNLKEYCCRKIDKRIGELLKKQRERRTRIGAKIYNDQKQKQEEFLISPKPAIYNNNNFSPNSHNSLNSDNSFYPTDPHILKNGKPIYRQPNDPYQQKPLSIQNKNYYSNTKKEYFYDPISSDQNQNSYGFETQAEHNISPVNISSNTYTTQNPYVMETPIEHNILPVNISNNTYLTDTTQNPYVMETPIEHNILPVNISNNTYLTDTTQNPYVPIEHNILPVNVSNNIYLTDTTQINSSQFTETYQDKVLPNITSTLNATTITTKHETSFPNFMHNQNHIIEEDITEQSSTVISSNVSINSEGSNGGPIITLNNSPPLSPLIGRYSTDRKTKRIYSNFSNYKLQGGGK